MTDKDKDKGFLETYIVTVTSTPSSLVDITMIATDEEDEEEKISKWKRIFKIIKNWWDNAFKEIDEESFKECMNKEILK